MHVTAFLSQIETHPDLEILEAQEGGYLVKGTDAEYNILTQAIEKHKWDVLEAILTGEREARVLRHMSRCVGYYSQIENWNKSKIGELKSRRAGNYSFEGYQDVHAPETKKCKAEAA